MNSDFHGEGEFIRSVQLVVNMVVVSLMLVAAAFTYCFLHGFVTPPPQQSQSVISKGEKAPSARPLWTSPDSTAIPETPEGDLIRYGRNLVTHTARYLGPKGTVKAISNGMNCQNCHLDAGTKPFGNNYAAVASTYPKYRTRSGTVESMEKRINDCLERSLNGEALEESSVEMRGIIAYFRWLGQDVEKGMVPEGTGIPALPFLDRPADPARGKAVYVKHCLVCHGQEGVGLKHPGSAEWIYPPLAGIHSYNVGAGLFRLSRFAGYVKNNMPHGTTYENPVLTNEEAWDVAAYVNALPRPGKDLSQDWPEISGKPFDHPFGPYADTFSEVQHKYGPFGPIVSAKKRSP